jgi:hypothetical protein
MAAISCCGEVGQNHYSTTIFLYIYGCYMDRPIKNKFSLMNEDEMIQYLLVRYQKLGIGSLSYVSIKKEKGLYFQIYKKGLNIKSIIKILGLEEEYNSFKTEHFSKLVQGKKQKRWSWERVIEESTVIVNSNGFLPPAQWFQQNKMGSLVFAVYKFNKNWNDLRAHFDSYESSNFIESRNGLRWNSHPEASLSNFLYSRGIEHKKGEKYPKEFKDYGDSNYGYFDLHFKAQNNELIDVEVWGDKPNGHNEEGYKKQREAKELFNTSNPRFLGIHYLDCFEEHLLEKILFPFIGVITPYLFIKNTDKIIRPTHWSNTDELIDFCKEISEKQPDGIFPTEEWLRKRGKWSDREGLTYNTVAVYIKTWIGGVRKLRKILNQSEHSTVSWTEEKLLKAYNEFFDEHGITPGQAKRRYEGLSEVELKKASSISAQVTKYFGSVKKINNILGISNIQKTKWNREVLLTEISKAFDKYSLMPNQLVNLSNNDKELLSVDDKDIATAKQIVGRISAYFEGMDEICDELGIRVLDIRKVRKLST